MSKRTKHAKAHARDQMSVVVSGNDFLYLRDGSYIRPKAIRHLLRNIGNRDVPSIPVDYIDGSIKQSDDIARLLSMITCHEIYDLEISTLCYRHNHPGYTYLIDMPRYAFSFMNDNRSIIENFGDTLADISDNYTFDGMRDIIWRSGKTYSCEENPDNFSALVDGIVEEEIDSLSNTPIDGATAEERHWQHLMDLDEQ